MPSLNFRAEPGHSQNQNQNQTLSPRLQHAVRLLQMSSLDFAAEVQDALCRNPFLESEDGEEGVCPSTQRAEQDVAGHADAHEQGLQHDVPDGPELHDGAHEVQGSDAEHGAGDEDRYSDRDLWQAEGASGLRRSDGGEMSAMDMMAVETPLNGHLHAQLNLLPLPARDLACARTVVESLDDDGYLRTPLEALLDVAALDPAANLEDMQIALKRVQSLEPAGVGARDVAECLLLQLPGIDCPQMQGLARRIVADHLQVLAARDVAGLARRLGEAPARVEAACDRIRRLDPRPGWRLGSSHIAYVVPDVVVKKLRGQWVVQLNPAVVPRVRLNQVYASLFQRHRSARNAEMAAHLHEARWTVRNVEQRFTTIVDVAEAIVERQKQFLEYGAMAMKPLGLKEVAEAVGVHESTVSRVTNNKFMSTPNGVFELKYFFSRAMVTANGSACSGTAIRGLIHDMIDAESPHQPLSDAEITRQLGRQGLVVARRTVTKYRQMLKFEAVERRRRLA